MQTASIVSDRYRGIESAFLYPQIVKQPKGFSSEPTQLRVVTLALQLTDDDEWQHNVVLPESAECPRVCEQDRGIQHEHAAKLRIRRGSGAHGTLQMGSAGCTRWRARRQVSAR